MEERPEGTPNPLNPEMKNVSLGTNVSVPMEVTPTNPVQPTPTGPAQPAPASPVQPDPVNPVQPAPVSPIRPVNHPRPVSPARPMVRNGAVRPIDMVRPTNTTRPIDMVRPVSTTQPIDSFQPQPTSIATPPQQSVTVQPKPTLVATTPQQSTEVQPQSTTDSLDYMDTLGVITNMDGTPAEKIDPMYRPMSRLATANEVKKPQTPQRRRRKKLLIGMLISLFLAICCGVAAILIIVNGPKEDMVAVAANRLISGNGPANIMIDGVIDYTPKSSDQQISSLKASIGTEAITKSKINSTLVKLNGNLRNGGSFTSEISEIYGANGDMYLKVDGLKDLKENTGLINGIEITDDMVESINGGWIRIPLDNLNINTYLDATNNKDTVCLVNFLGDVNNDGNTLAGMYLKNPFITSTDQDLAIASERDPIYKVVFNEQNFRAFANEALNTTSIKNLTDCLGYQNFPNKADKLWEIIQQLPDLYAEVNGDADFTRLYFDATTNVGKIKADIRFSYPNNVNVPEPVEYKDISEFIKPNTETAKEGTPPEETPGQKFENEELLPQEETTRQQSNN